MPASHACLCCGLDLARCRAQREPYYGLRLVTCPRCGRHAVRSRDPVVRGWRRFAAALAALGTIGLFAVLAPIGAVATFLALVDIADADNGRTAGSAIIKFIRALGGEMHRGQDLQTRAVAGLVSAVVTGATVGIFLHHRRLAHRAAVLACLLLFPWLILVTHEARQHESLIEAAFALDRSFRTSRPILEVLALAWAAGLLGLLLEARLSPPFRAARRRSRFRRRRRRYRAIRETL